MSIEPTPIYIQLTHPDAVAPQRQSEGAAGYDLYADEFVVLRPQTRCCIKTGFAIEIPKGYYGRVASRSGLAFHNGVVVEAGTIDSDYRGEVKVLLFNLGQEDYAVENGSRIAQLVIEKIITPPLKVVEDLSSTTRGANGFGSTKGF
jgi:dUTP pyrophosphatase